jgi:hypothetical protein
MDKKTIIVDFTIRASVEVEDNWQEQLLHLQNVFNNVDFSLSINNKKTNLLETWLEKIQIREIK